MGKEEIIYGARHRELFRKDPYADPSNEDNWGTFWPNAIRVETFPGGDGVNVKTIGFDQATGQPDDRELSATLDRAGCNRLIKALRKHRDAMYGADA